MRNLFKIAGLLALTGFISSCNDKETTANYQGNSFTSRKLRLLKANHLH